MTGQPIDECLSLLSDGCRREVVRQLRHDTGGSTTIDELADRMHGDELAFGTDGGTDREELAIHLHHAVAPKLEAHGVVEHDRRSGAIAYQSDERVEAILDSLSDETPVSPLES